MLNPKSTYFILDSEARVAEGYDCESIREHTHSMVWSNQLFWSILWVDSLTQTSNCEFTFSGFVSNQTNANSRFIGERSSYKVFRSKSHDGSGKFNLRSDHWRFRRWIASADDRRWIRDHNCWRNTTDHTYSVVQDVTGTAYVRTSGKNIICPHIT